MGNEGSLSSLGLMIASSNSEPWRLGAVTTLGTACGTFSGLIAPVEGQMSSSLAVVGENDEPPHAFGTSGASSG